MKYGLLIDFKSPHCNYGDYVQSIAIEYIYELIGIQESDIVFITANELSTYKGEKLLLPYNYVLHFLVSEKDGCAALSDEIIPVFLGASIEFAMLINSYPLENFADPQKKWIELLQKYSPIGCRDEYTHQFFSSFGIQSYVQGCITNIFPKRKPGNYRKILLVDCPAEIITYLPDELLENIEVLSNAQIRGDLSVEENYKKIKKRYNYYRDNAALIITTRYHVATPCNAMGIPIVYVMRTFDKHLEDIRLDTLHPNIQLCPAAEYASINWHPQWKDFEELKTDIIQLAISRIHEAYERYTQSERIYDYFRPRINSYRNLPTIENTYKIRLQKFIQKNYHAQIKGGYYIWGAIQLLCEGNNVMLVNLVAEENMNLNFLGWIDTYKTGFLAGKPIIKPIDILLNENEFVIVAAETAIADALKLFHEIGLNSNQYLVLANRMIEKEDIDQMKKKRWEK